MYAKLSFDMAICLTTFKREKLCRRLIESIKNVMPEIPIFIANDGETPINIEGAYVYNLDFDLGVSFKRNYLAEHIPKEYTYLTFVDDDMVFTEKTRLDIFREMLDQDQKLSLVSGEVYDFGTILRPYEAHFEWEDNDTTLRLVAYNGEGIVDLTQNFFMIRRSVFTNSGWKNHLKLAEHVPFFIDLKNNNYVCSHTKQVSIDHFPEVAGSYSTFRSRHGQFQKIWMEETGIKKVIRPNGIEILYEKLDEPDYWPWVAESKELKNK
ncbi:MAG: glycosyltransferase [Fluviicola sp.]|nr:glycosyltransferase [Fluviicola sp.]